MHVFVLYMINEPFKYSSSLISGTLMEHILTENFLNGTAFEFIARFSTYKFDTLSMHGRKFNRNDEKNGYLF